MFIDKKPDETSKVLRQTNSFIIHIKLFSINMMYYNKLWLIKALLLGLTKLIINCLGSKFTSVDMLLINILNFFPRVNVNFENNYYFVG